MAQEVGIEQKETLMQSWDVIVAGGGVAGIAAALSAKRAGAKRVLLLERQYLLGGLATCGLVAIYLPICDGNGYQVCTGLAEELLLLSMRHGAEGRYPSAWVSAGSTEEKKQQRYQVQYNPWLFAIECEQLLLNEGVQILYGAMVFRAHEKKGRLESIEIVHKSGCETLYANAFVDATGDADMFWQTGAPTKEYTDGNVLASWYYVAEDGINKLHWMGFHDQANANCQNSVISDQCKLYHGVDIRELTEMSISAHHTIKESFLSKGTVSPAHSLSSIAFIPQVRMTRRGEGLIVLDDTHPFAYQPTSVGRITDWRSKGNAFELPLEALISCSISNLYAAGRCISVTDKMWDITRSIPNCVVSGQAAGTAAALQGDTLQTIQCALAQQQVKIHFE